MSTSRRRIRWDRVEAMVGRLRGRVPESEIERRVRNAASVYTERGGSPDPRSVSDIADALGVDATVVEEAEGWLAESRERSMHPKGLDVSAARSRVRSLNRVDRVRARRPDS